MVATIFEGSPSPHLQTFDAPFGHRPAPKQNRRLRRSKSLWHRFPPLLFAVSPRFLSTDSVGSDHSNRPPLCLRPFDNEDFLATRPSSFSFFDPFYNSSSRGFFSVLGPRVPVRNHFFSYSPPTNPRTDAKGFNPPLFLTPPFKVSRKLKRVLVLPVLNGTQLVSLPNPLGSVLPAPPSFSFRSPVISYETKFPVKEFVSPLAGVSEWWRQVFSFLLFTLSIPSLFPVKSLGRWVPETSAFCCRRFCFFFSAIS